MPSFCGLLPGQLALALLAVADLRDLARPALIGGDLGLVTGIGDIGQTQYLDRQRRPGLVDEPPVLVQHRADAAELLPAQEHIALPERAALDQDRGHRSTPLIEPRLDHGAGGRAVPDGRELHHLGLQQDGLQQGIDPLAGLGRYRREQDLAAPLLGEDAVHGQLLLDAIRIGLRFVDLGDGDQDRDRGGLGVLDGLDRLGLDAVVGGDHQDDDVRHLGAAGPHRGEGRMPGGIEEGDAALFGRDVIGTDVLRDPAGLPRRDPGAPDVIEQRRLTVIDMPHDGHHGRSRIGLCLARGGGAHEVGLERVVVQEPGLVPHLFHDDGGGFLVDDLVDIRHRPDVHQALDHLGGLDRHPLGQLRDRHAIRYRDLAHDGRGRHREPVPGRDRHDHPACHRLSLAAPRLAGRDMQLLAARRGCAIPLLAPRRRSLRTPLLGRRRLRGRRGDDHGCLACLLLRGAGALARLGLLGLALGRLVPLAFLFLTALLRKAGLFLGGLLEGQDAFALGRLFGTFLGLSLRHHAALDVGAALAELDAHGLGGGPRPAALDRELDLAHGLALQDDARRLLAFGTPPMALSEVRQQGALLVFGDGVAGLAVGQSGLVELRDQAIHGDPDDLGELFDRHVSHRAFLRPVVPLRPMRTTGRAPP